jgi:ubiquinone/menaquinone biosynthesis C-methylase UbiE
MAAIEPGQRVVDVACGPGPITFAAAKKVGPDGMVLGTDISERMVQQARERARVQEFEHVSFLRCDAEAELPGSASFDTALCSLGLMYAPDPRMALKRMRRALRPGGRVAAAVWGQRARCGWAEIFPIVDARVQSAVCPMFFQLGTGEALAGELEAAGFAQVELRRISTTLHYPSAAQAVGAAFLGGPVALACSRFDEETRRTAEWEYLASLEPYREGTAYALPGEFVVASGIAQED